MGPLQTEFADLLRRARVGEGEALGALLDLYRQRLRAAAARELGDQLRVRVDASDMVQQTVLSAVRSFDEFVGNDEKAFLAWVERIQARNVQDCIRHHVEAERRSVGREADVEVGMLGEGKRRPSEESIVEQNAINNEQFLQLQTALASLPMDQREAVRMRHIEGKALHDVALQLGRSKVATASLIARGLKIPSNTAGRRDK